ncbi:MAG: CcmD family protein [Chloroflexota bacterium]|nr:CcmD family protein [Chloroflexota bacterium]
MDVTLQDLAKDIHNLAYFFSAYTVFWVLIVAYLFTLARREQALRDEIAMMKKGADADSQKER